jgi:hypothetical protein
MKTLFCTGALALCTLAAAAPPANAGDFWSNLFIFTHDDFRAADADAKAHNDTLASECWEGADTYLSSEAAKGSGFVPPGAPVGAASAFQAARDTVRFGLSVARNFQATGKVPVPLEQACGPLFVDSLDDLRDAGNVAGLGALNVVVAGKTLF